MQTYGCEAAEHQIAPSCTKRYVDPSPQQVVSWVPRIQAGEASAIEELHALLSRGLRSLFMRQLGPGYDAEDGFQDTFLIMIQAIQKGAVREPERLAGFVRTVAQRQIAKLIEQRIEDRRR